MKRILALFIMVSSAFAQAPKQTTVGGFDTTGGVTVGYRFTDVAGRQPEVR